MMETVGLMGGAPTGELPENDRKYGLLLGESECVAKNIRLGTTILVGGKKEGRTRDDMLT